MRDDNKTPFGGAVIQNTGIINVFDLLDSSSSMNQHSFDRKPTKYDNAVTGLKENLNALSQDENAKYTFSLFEFGNDGKFVEQYFMVSTVPTAKLNSLRCFNSGTALNDSIVRLLDTIERTKLEGNVIVNIMTDGQEMHSKLYSAANVRDKIEKCKSLGYTITFIGTEADVQYAIRQYGIEASNTLSYDGTADGMKMSSQVFRSSTLSYSKKMAAGASADELVASFYSQS